MQPTGVRFGYRCPEHGRAGGRRAGKLGLAFLLAAAAVLAVGAWAQELEGAAAATPRGAVERLHDALVEAAQAQLSAAGRGLRVERDQQAPAVGTDATSGGLDPAIDARYAMLEPVVRGTHDLPYIAELTIRREWASLSDDQRGRFLDAFTRLSVMTYASRFGNLEAGMFEIGESEDLPRGRARVFAALTTSGGATIPFEYVLHEADSGWKIVNILADDVSDLALKRSEYRRLLDDGAIDDVIADLERQAADLAAGE